MEIAKNPNSGVVKCGYFSDLAKMANRLRNRTTIELNIEFSTFNNLEVRQDSVFFDKLKISLRLI